ncbi:mariner Mos1 transposase [Elysia marginata]|uniref:Mariner Mos1 transposase n=1 Tax=Elysia marginata TaxID=1093978 RepID=A0AAV4ET32_9GAST|nr:mariner Mos1 transposase [Elysia marginata]
MNGVILRWPVPIGTTINAQYYKKVLQDKLRPAIRKKRPGLLESGILFHHDNAPVHTARAGTGVSWLQVGTAGASSLSHLTVTSVIFTYSLK